jgi:hypothetical protein
VTSGPDAAQHLRDLARLRRVRDRIDREYAQPLDIEAKLAEVTAARATVKEPAHDLGGGRLVATVTDPDGNVLGLLQDQ